MTEHLIGSVSFGSTAFEAMRVPALEAQLDSIKEELRRAKDRIVKLETLLQAARPSCDESLSRSISDALTAHK